MKEINEKEQNQEQRKLFSAMTEVSEHFQTLLDALQQMTGANDKIIEANVNGNALLKTQQDRIYEFNQTLIYRINTAIFGETPTPTPTPVPDTTPATPVEEPVEPEPVSEENR